MMKKNGRYLCYSVMFVTIVSAAAFFGCGGGGTASTSSTATGQLITTDTGTTPDVVTPVTTPSGSTLNLSRKTILTDANNAPVTGTIPTTVTFSTSPDNLPAAAVTPVVPDVAVFQDINLNAVKNINPPMTAIVTVPGAVTGELVDIFSFDNSTLTWKLELSDVPVASDGTASFTIPHLTIWAAAKKNRLIIKGNPKSSVTVNTSYSFKPNVISNKMTSLTFSIINKPVWASFNTATGELSGTPTAADVGTTFGIVISVTDGTLTASLAPFNLTVTATGSTGSGGGTL